MLDTAIIGSGPAALTAAIYLARAGFKVKIFEGQKVGGTLTEIAKISNFPGFVGKGSDLAENIRKQAISAGAEVVYGEFQGFINDDIHRLLIDGEEVSARTVLIATGSEPRKLKTETNTPISYCAACDGALYKDKDIIVIGGGNSAVQESVHLAKIVKKLTLISRSTLSAKKMLIQELSSYQNTEILENTEPTTEQLNAVDGVFAFIGKIPATSALSKEVLDSQKYIITDSENMTSVQGLFAAGDVRQGTIKQAVTAAADGAAAAIHICNFLEKA